MRTVLFVGVAVATLAGPAAAQQSADQGPVTTVDDIVVRGQLRAIRETTDAKWKADQIVDGVSADDIGSIPDFGLGEAVQRITGVSMIINNGRGESQFMTIRGLNPDYNAVIIDGVSLPATETTRRIVSLDVIPSSFVTQALVYKTAFADLPSSAVGGLTTLRTRSAFDAAGLFIGGRLNIADWANERRFVDSTPSGQAELTVSERFGANDQFGVVLQVGQYLRDSSTLNTAMDTYGFYNYSGGVQTLPALRQANANATLATLQPGDGVAGLTAVPDRFRWLTYDNVRERQSYLGKLEYRGAGGADLSLTLASFKHLNDENRYSQFINRVGDATITSPTTGSFARGSAQVDFDNFNQTRGIEYVQLDGALPVRGDWRAEAVVNLARGNYRQATIEDVFTQAASATLASDYISVPGETSLFLPRAGSTYFNPASYLQSHHLTRDERSSTETGTFKALIGNDGPDHEGVGFEAGIDVQDRRIDYDLEELRFNRAPIATTSLATVGVLAQDYRPYNGAGLGLLVIDTVAAQAFYDANRTNPALLVPAASNTANSSIPDFGIQERVAAGYALATYRGERFSAGAGLRYETYEADLSTSQPSPLNSTTNYVSVDRASDDRHLLPSAWANWTPAPAWQVRLAFGRTLARPRYADLAQNGSPGVNTVAFTASQSVANPDLEPRTANSYDASLEWRPHRDLMMSAALFHKDIENEIVTLSSTASGVTLPGLAGTYTYTTSRSENAGDAQLQGIEFGFSAPRLTFLPGPLRYLGFVGNLTFIDMEAPSIRMSNGTFRRLPQLFESARVVGNASLLFNVDRWSGNLSYSHTGETPVVFDTNNVVNDRYFDALDVFDAQLRYDWTDNLSLIVQGKNLTNARPTRVTGPGRSLAREELDNGSSYYVGLNFRY